MNKAVLAMSEIIFSLLQWLSKLLVYLGGAAVIGGFFCLLLSRTQPQLTLFIRRYISSGVLLALLAVAVNFFAQVGSFAEAGWAGLVDSVYVELLWDSPIGVSLLLRVAALGGVCCLLLLALLRARGRLSFISNSHQNALVILLLGLSGVLWAISFNLTGHTTELNHISRFLLSLHGFIALLWIGSLLPLWQACRCVAVKPLQQLMRRFGELVMGLVILLLICGGILVYQLLGSFGALIGTSYGQMMLLKVLLVGLLLGFAAWHKWQRVPQLIQPLGIERLRRSILLEGLVGLGVLVMTVLLTTAVGPAMPES